MRLNNGRCVFRFEKPRVKACGASLADTPVFFMSKDLYFGIDVGATFTKAAMVDEKGRIVAKHKVSSGGFSDRKIFLKSIREDFYKFFLGKGFSFAQVKGIGIGLPGPIDFHRGIVLNLTNIKGWSDFCLVDYLRKFFSIPIYIENDANCMALAESRMGAGRGASFALFMTLGTGVGGGLILNNEIYRGPFFLGGEVGHIPLAFKGPKCACGGVACLERYVGNHAIERMIKEKFGTEISLERVSSMAKAGNKKARAVWEEVGRYIGLAVSGVVNVFNPQVIVIGGGVSSAGDALMDSIKKTVKLHAMAQLKKHLKIKKALLGNDAGVLGAVLLAKENIEVGCRR